MNVKYLTIFENESRIFGHPAVLFWATFACAGLKALLASLTTLCRTPYTYLCPLSSSVRVYFRFLYT
ncbi:hypothetical protein CPB83DRAFT_861721 [Crepidotus variabilis]|uniref:Uncharacterized protein n=1 Tax=Crepidotus variabilis TaxID=179855 RepID=A0A9P6JKT7_9AGAR|nr:hypothetical protein CPB83DRAFT_861721 [Crepidotus variabilis]